MRTHLKKTLTALVSLSLLPVSALATIVAPHEGAITAATYYSSGAFHGALDLASGKACGSVVMDAPIVGAVAWNVTLRTSGMVCAGNGSGNQNEVKHTFSNGYTFRVWHFLKTAASVDKTCDRCPLGLEGGTGSVTAPHTHLQYDKSGTNNTAWYSGSGATRGHYYERGEVISTTP